MTYFLAEARPLKLLEQKTLALTDVEESVEAKSAGAFIQMYSLHISWFKIFPYQCSDLIMIHMPRVFVLFWICITVEDPLEKEMATHFSTLA